MDNYTATYGNSVAEALPEERATFIRKTYFHLAGAIFAFIALEGYLMFSGLGAQIAATMLGSTWSWLLVLLAFMGVSMLANWWANSQRACPFTFYFLPNKLLLKISYKVKIYLCI